MDIVFNLKFLIYISFLFIASSAFAQDKLFLKNGNIIHCKVVSIAENTVSYKDTLGSSNITTISKSDVLIADKKGQVFIFGTKASPDPLTILNSETREQRKERKLKEWKQKEQDFSNDILGIYIPELAIGRLTISYERLIANKSVGILIPASLTYDPTNFLLTSSSSTTTTSSSRRSNRGVGFISGVDINYYYDLKPGLKFYFGPRVRYGTDILLGSIEGLTGQLQSGFFSCRNKGTTSNIGFGVGFFKLSQKYANYPGYEPKQVYPWVSLTWRIGFRL